VTTPDTGRGENRIDLWRSARNVLCIRLDNMGDVLMTTPAIRALKEMPTGIGEPTAARRITLLASRSGARVARYVPEIDAVLAYHAPWMKASAPLAPGVHRSFVAKLQRARFDAAVIFTCYSQSALPAAMLCALAGIPLRLAHCRENPYALLTDWLAEKEPHDGVRHEVQRQVDLVRSIGARPGDARLSLRIPDRKHRAVAAKLARLGLPRASSNLIPAYFVLHPGATAPSRRYAAERFAVVARRLIEELQVPVVVTGDASERELAAAIAVVAGPDAINAAGVLSLGEFASAIAGAALLISNNTGAVHIAAALGVPVVDLYALTNPQHTPWMVPHRILNRDVVCRYCYKSVCPERTGACLDVPPEEVVQAARSLWRPMSSPPAGIIELVA
jgi:ADP-heptose:LPS heptosyltransferase